MTLIELIQNPVVYTVASVLGVLSAAEAFHLLKKRRDDRLFANPPLDLTGFRKEHAGDELTFAFYGDSITRGTYSSNPTDQPTSLIQAAIPGSTWRDGTMPGRRLLDFIPLITPGNFFISKYTVIEHGVIDSWQGYDVVENYRRLITRIRAENSIPIVTGFSNQVVCATITDEHLAGQYTQNAKLKLLCKELHVPFADWGTVEFHGADDLMDGVHPKKPYSDRLVARLLETINQTVNLK